MRPIVLLSDFGDRDHYVGVMHAVLHREAPLAPRIDLTHQVAPGDVWEACYLLRCAWPHLPADTVVVAVVDPGVGTERRAVAVRLGQRWLVAPDNGLAVAPAPVTAARMIDHVSLGLAEPSRTFHGRDLFAPAAARIARGDDPVVFGSEVSPEKLVPCPLPEPQPTADGVRATVIHVDRFGNQVTNVRADSVGDKARASWGSGRPARRVATYGEATPDEIVLLEGSAGYLELAVNCGSAAEATGLRRGDQILITD